MGRKWYRITAKSHKLMFWLMFVIPEKALYRLMQTAGEFSLPAAWVRAWVWGHGPIFTWSRKRDGCRAWQASDHLPPRGWALALLLSDRDSLVRAGLFSLW